MTATLEHQDPPARRSPRASRVRVEDLRANPCNIRTDLGDLRELTESIRYEGVLVPLMAEERGSYLQILHGHRRWAAAQLAGVTRVPVIVVGRHTAAEAMLVMLAEDKKEPIDRADRRRAILALREKHHMSWQDIADRLGVTCGTALNWAGQKRDNAPTGQHRNDRPRPPRVTASDVHNLLARFDDGELVPTDIVEALREWLGDWTPTPKAAKT